MLDILIKQSEDKQDNKTLNVSERVDKPIKSFMKAVSWRIVGTLDTILISYFITGTITAALSIGTIEVISKTILYYFHERLWAHIHKIKLNIFTRPNGKQYQVKRVERSTVR